MPDVTRLRSAINVIRQYSRASVTAWPVAPVIKCKMCGADSPEIESPHAENCPIAILERGLAELEASNA